MGRWYNDILEQWGVGTMIYFNNGTLVKLHTEAMGRWYNDILEQWGVGTMTYWSNGALVQ